MEAESGYKESEYHVKESFNERCSLPIEDDSPHS